LKSKNPILNQTAAQKKNQNPQQPSILIKKASKYQTQSKLWNYNLNQIQNPERKQSQRCQTEGHQLPKAKASPNGQHHICTQEKDKIETLSESMNGFKQ
jgi:hypothetical protein